MSEVNSIMPTTTSTPRSILIAFLRQMVGQHEELLTKTPDNVWNQEYAKMLRACANWLEQEGDIKQAPSEASK